MMEVAGRRVHILGATTNPTGQRGGAAGPVTWWWTSGNLVVDLGRGVSPFRLLIRDRDARYTAGFDEVLHRRRRRDRADTGPGRLA
jgi:hypothetical protein